MADATTNIHTATQRALAVWLETVFPDTTIARSLIPSVPEQNRITVLPGAAPARIAVDTFQGGAVRGRRGDDFTVRVWIECIGDELDEVEDKADGFAADLEAAVAAYPTLNGDVDGLVMFGQHIDLTPHPMVELGAGLFYRIVELEISAKGRYY